MLLLIKRQQLMRVPMKALTYRKLSKWSKQLQRQCNMCCQWQGLHYPRSCHSRQWPLY